MLTRRIIPCLDVKDGRVVKGISFLNHRDAGDPVALAAAYDAAGADELVFYDITASSDERATMIDVVERTAAQVFIPLTVGGGIRTVEDMYRMLRAGADKISINTAAVLTPNLIEDGAKRFGSQCIVLSIDARRVARTEDRGLRTELEDVALSPQSSVLGSALGSLYPHRRQRARDRAGCGRVGAAGRGAGRGRDCDQQHGCRWDARRL